MHAGGGEPQSSPVDGPRELGAPERAGGFRPIEEEEEGDAIATVEVADRRVPFDAPKKKE